MASSISLMPASRHTTLALDIYLPRAAHLSARHLYSAAMRIGGMKQTRLNSDRRGWRRSPHGRIVKYRAAGVITAKRRRSAHPRLSLETQRIAYRLSCNALPVSIASIASAPWRRRWRRRTSVRFRGAEWWHLREGRRRRQRRKAGEAVVGGGGEPMAIFHRRCNNRDIKGRRSALGSVEGGTLLGVIARRAKSQRAYDSLVAWLFMT